MLEHHHEKVPHEESYEYNPEELYLDYIIEKATESID